MNRFFAPASPVPSPEATTVRQQEGRSACVVMVMVTAGASGGSAVATEVEIAGTADGGSTRLKDIDDTRGTSQADIYLVYTGLCIGIYQVYICENFVRGRGRVYPSYAAVGASLTQCRHISGEQILLIVDRCALPRDWC